MPSEIPVSSASPASARRPGRRRPVFAPVESLLRALDPSFAHPGSEAPWRVVVSRARRRGLTTRWMAAAAGAAVGLGWAGTSPLAALLLLVGLVSPAVGVPTTLVNDMAKDSTAANILSAPLEGRDWTRAFDGLLAAGTRVTAALYGTFAAGSIALNRDDAAAWLLANGTAWSMPATSASGTVEGGIFTLAAMIVVTRVWLGTAYWTTITRGWWLVGSLPLTGAYVVAVTWALPSGGRNGWDFSAGFTLVCAAWGALARRACAAPGGGFPRIARDVVFR